MIIFGYNFTENPRGFIKENIDILPFSSSELVTKDDIAVIFGVSFTGDSSFSFEAVADICNRAGSIIYISSSSVYSNNIRKHRETDECITPVTLDGAVNLSLEEYILDTCESNKSSCVILRVDILEESGLVEILNSRASRGLSGSILHRMSVISLKGLFFVLERVCRDIHKHAGQIYNVATKAMTEFEYYNAVVMQGKIYVALRYGNTSLNIKKAKEAGIL